MKQKSSANYDFKQKAPKRKMGEDQFSQLPKGVIMKPFSSGASYRGGIMNNPATGINDLSEVDENGRR